MAVPSAHFDWKVDVKEAAGVIGDGVCFIFLCIGRFDVETLVHVPSG